MNKVFKLLFSSFFLIISVTNVFSNEKEKLKIGLLIPLTGENYELGQTIIKAARIAMSDIDSDQIEIIVKDTKSDAKIALRSALELKEQGIKLVIGPVFFKSLEYLGEIEDMIFISHTNKTVNLPKNVISSGVNSTSQLNTIKKFLKNNDISKTIFLVQKLTHDE